MISNEFATTYAPSKKVSFLLQMAKAIQWKQNTETGWRAKKKLNKKSKSRKWTREKKIMGKTTFLLFKDKNREFSKFVRGYAKEKLRKNNKKVIFKIM